jgi:hypothetical protein
MGEGSVNFEFVHGPFTINIADYTREHGYQPSYSSIEPEGKISVLVQRYGETLSPKTVERLADYIEARIKGVCVSSNHVMELGLQQDDQFMYYLLKALDIIIP